LFEAWASAAFGSKCTAHLGIRLTMTWKMVSMRTPFPYAEVVGLSWDRLEIVSSRSNMNFNVHVVSARAKSEVSSRSRAAAFLSRVVRQSRRVEAFRHQPDLTSSNFQCFIFLNFPFTSFYCVSSLRRDQRDRCLQLLQYSLLAARRLRASSTRQPSSVSLAASNAIMSSDQRRSSGATQVCMYLAPP